MSLQYLGPLGWLLPYSGVGTSPPPPPPPPSSGGQLQYLGPFGWLLPFSGAGEAPSLPYDLYEAVLALLRSAVPLQSDDWSGWHSGPSSQPGYPAGRVEDVGGTETYASGGPTITDGMLQVSVFASDRATAARKADAARDALYDAQLTYTRGRSLFLRPVGPHRAIPEPGPAVGGSGVYHAVRTFRYQVTSTD